MNQASGPITSPIMDYLQELHHQFAGLNDGEVADYIPELAKADSDWFGICIATTEGHVYEIGDSRQEFTIQSISKPFVYGLALEDNGRADMLGKIGVEPTGDAFNSISLDPLTGRPAEIAAARRDISRLDTRARTPLPVGLRTRVHDLGLDCGLCFHARQRLLAVLVLDRLRLLLLDL